MSDPTSRTLALLSLLQTHRHWKGAELADRLGVSERTVRRDVDRLRTLGYPVEANAGVEGGYQLASGANLPPLLIDDEEAVALTVGLRTVAGAAIGGIEETTVRVLAKLDRILPDRLRRQVEAVSTSVEFLRHEPSEELVAVDTLTVLSQGCRDHEEVRFDYVDKKGAETRRLVRPHHLVVVGRRWYLIAWDVRRDDWRTFRLDRAREPRLAGVRFTPMPLPTDPASFVAGALKATAPVHEAVLEVDAAAERVADRLRWYEADVRELDRDRTEVRLRTDNEPWLAVLVATTASLGRLTVRSLPPSTAALVAELRDNLGAL
ncbi:MAG: helix-turn-helix transcriptional regulator [Acidimicrobiales bacterium]